MPEGEGVGVNVVVGVSMGPVGVIVAVGVGPVGVIVNVLERVDVMEGVSVRAGVRLGGRVGVWMGVMLGVRLIVAEGTRVSAAA